MLGKILVNHRNSLGSLIFFVTVFIKLAKLQCQHLMRFQQNVAVWKGSCFSFAVCEDGKNSCVRLRPELRILKLQISEEKLLNYSLN